MKVSLFTVTNYADKYLADCFDSVVYRDDANMEDIVIDSASTNNTRSILADHAGAIDQGFHETDGGMYDAINQDLKMANGDVIVIWNNDNFFVSPQAVSQIVACFRKKEVDPIYRDLVYIDEENAANIYRYWKGGTYERSVFRFGWMPAHLSFYVRREVVESLGGCETRCYSASDFESVTRYLYRYRISSA